MRLRPSICQRIVLIVVAVGVFFTSASVPAQTKASSGAETEVLEAEHQWDDATANTDIAAMERLLAENFMYVHIEGGVLTREQWLGFARKMTPERIKERKTTLTAVHRDQETVRVFGNDVAIISFVSHLATGVGRAPDTRQTDVWVRVGGAWRLAHGQITKIEPLPPRPAK